MFLNIIITVLRETLEAGVLISLLLSVSHYLKLNSLWLWPALLTGLFGAAIYALNLGAITDWFDYVGQEVVNAFLHFAIFACLGGVIINIRKSHNTNISLMVCLLATIVSLAIVREGGELFVFYSGYLQTQESLVSALTSGLIGLLIGSSVGALFYFLLVTLPVNRAQQFRLIMLYLVAAGMVLQGTQLLIQADWLPSYHPLWNSNWLLAEASVAGQLIYAVFGYESTPSIIEVAAYALAVAFIFLSRLVLGSLRHKPTKPFEEQATH